MEPHLLEVKNAVVHSYDGVHEVEGGAYLSPEAYLKTTMELEQLRRRRLADSTTLIPGLLFSFALLGMAAGYWLGTSRRRPRDRR